MKSVLTLIAVAFTALVSNAAQAEGSYSPQPQQKPGAAAPQPGAGQSQQPAADNTGRNEGDRQGGRLDAGDQSNNEQDVALTAKIRRALTDDSGLSMSAHNVKIITVGNRVTLRGPVNSAAERTRVESIAKQAAGQQRTVVNELEVKQ